MFAEHCERIENLRPDSARIEEGDISKINAVIQKQENFARKINPYYVSGQINYKRNSIFEEKNEIIVVRKVTSIPIVENKMLYSHEQLYIHICKWKHIQHNKDERTVLYKNIPLTLLKGL